MKKIKEIFLLLFGSLMGPFNDFYDVFFDNDSHKIISKRGREILDSNKKYTYHVDEDGDTYINIEDEN